MPENTSDRDPLIHFLGAMSGSMNDYITGMESAGQRQLVAEKNTIPTQGSDKLTDLGFVLGDVHEGDPMFRDATFPFGWTKRGSDHAMWSYIDDELGRERVAIFYKAAFYDRNAFCRVNDVMTYLWGVAEGDRPLVLDDVWATKNAVIELVHERMVHLAEDTATWRRYEKERDDADFSKFIQENAEKVTKWQAILDHISAEEEKSDNGQVRD